MKIIESKLFNLMLIVFILSTVADASCIVELNNSVKSSHVSVEACGNVGVFSIGTLEANQWESLTYRYPKPWKGTYLSIKIDDVLYSNSRYSPGAVLMDDYVTIGPQKSSSNTILTKWSLPEGVDVKQVITLADGGAIVQVQVVNNCGLTYEISSRLSLDLMVDGNDGAPIAVPGKGVLSKEFSYSGSQLDFDYVVAQDREINPALSRAIYFSYGAEKPAKVVFGNWKTSRSPEAWDYAVDTSRSTELDSALLLYYGPKNIAPDQALDFEVYYGMEAVAPSCSDGIRNQGESDVDCGGPCQPCSVGALCNKHSDCATGYCSESICAKTVTPTTEPVSVQPSLPSGTIIAVLAVVVLLIIALIFLRKKPKAEKAAAPAAKPVVVPPVVAPSEKPVVVPPAPTPSAKPAKGQIVVEKKKSGGAIKITVKNSSSENLRNCILVESVPSGADIKFKAGKNVNRKRNKLIWSIGDLAAGKQTVLEYTTSSDKKSKIENFSFLSLNPVLAKINEA